ncbi:predicted protein [Aspergillus nidulans FGSC A4]|uniref:Uncharacterized protein n=1 Tax=Emericella nidulans (strain FGSC A4 / ATCC 38163 / CBS 112.46 / NRRL 194 / M139) TaxID=227321 RepID=Q5AQT1_EMENI|nr:hypothetical protein [Aspergillus nidulans FGSC A4]EAA66416.1 predicted protein [Aspergillus nidulans FGSC A4]CBF87453.1 TPA: hypothetical protein ANIA_09349 [Aspergillus nidulans FGSC A4]|eukprot:XP_682618.1 predicted protein [Aspergillus nidulans FGSC A4]
MDEWKVDPGPNPTAAAYRLLNERQGNRKGRDWGSRCMKIWQYFDNPAFRIQLFIETLNEGIQREFARAPQAPLISGRCYRTSCSLRKRPISREEPTKPQRGGHQSDVGGPTPATGHQPTYKRKRESSPGLGPSFIFSVFCLKDGTYHGGYYNDKK